MRSKVLPPSGRTKDVTRRRMTRFHRTVPEPEVLRVIGEESQRKDTDKLSSRQIDRIIKAARASHQGYGRWNIEHHRTVRLSPCSLEILDEMRGAGEHSLELRFVLGPEWLFYPEIMCAEKVTGAIAGPRGLTFLCEAESALDLSVLPVQISREYGAAIDTHCIRIQTSATLPATLETRVQWN